MVVIVNVETGQTNETIEQPFRHIIRELASALEVPKGEIVLLTEAGETVDPWTRPTMSRYFLLRKDEFKLLVPNMDELLADPPHSSGVTNPYSEPFNFARAPALQANTLLISTDLNVFDSVRQIIKLHEQSAFLLEQLVNRKLPLVVAENRCDAVSAVLKGVKRYYKALKEKELVHSRALDELPPLRESYREQIRKLANEAKTPTLDSMLKFLSEKDFGRIYKRKHELAKVKRAEIHGRFPRIKDRIRAQERLLSECKVKTLREHEALFERFRNTESEVMVSAVESISTYSDLREKLDSAKNTGRGGGGLPTDLSLMRAEEARVRMSVLLIEDLKALAVQATQNYCTQLENIAKSAAKLTFELHIKVADKLPKLDALIKSLSKHIPLLTLPEQAPRICAAIDEELSRREHQSQSITSEYRSLEDRIHTEQAHRAQFLQDWGRSVPAEMMPEGFTELPDLIGLRREVEVFETQTGSKDDEEMELAMLEAQYAAELAELMSRKRYLEGVEMQIRSKLGEQEQLSADLRRNIERLQPAQPAIIPPTLLQDFATLKQEQSEFLAGLNRRS